MSEDDKKQQQQPLAFASDPQLTPATSQSRLTTKDGATLNIEYFSSQPSNDKNQQQKQPPLVNLLFIHGICESAETWAIQHLARAAAKTDNINLIVLELEGHGLSSGPRAVNGDFHRLRRHVGEFIIHHRKTNDPHTLYAIGGTSLGGALAAYAACEFKSDPFCLGTILIAPAVGVDARAVPPPPIVTALRCVAMVCPGMQLPLTPYEDPSHYACPSSSSTRNFKGYWPLATSRMLLDVTAGGVMTDLKDGTLAIDGDIAVLVMAGEADNVVPLDAVRKFFDKIGATNKEFVPVVGAGHDLMFEAKTAGVVIEKVFCWINSLLESRR